MQSHSHHLTKSRDANYNFLVVDIGAEGQSDGGIKKKSFIGQALINGEADLPPSKQIHEDGPVLPHVLRRRSISINDLYDASISWKRRIKCG